MIFNLFKTTGNSASRAIRRASFAIMTLIAAAYANAQSMSVAKFYLDEKDLTANSGNTIKTDQNGAKAALIKIQTTQKGFLFDVGALGIVAVEEQNTEHPAEIWLYVPNGVKRISIQHASLGVINDYDLGTSLKKGKTYILQLTADQVATMVVDYSKQQFLDVTLTPSNAELFINGLKQTQSAPGSYAIQLPFGSHNVRVTAPNYHTAESSIDINDPNNRQKANIRLKQAFGYISVEGTGDAKGATVTVDGTAIGTAPISNHQVPSGVHNIVVTQNMFAPHTQQINMTDSAFIQIRPTLAANFAEVDINVGEDNNIQIYDNGLLLASGNWKGKLGAGTHVLEARRANHHTVSKTITVKKDIPLKTTIDAPTPILTSLSVTSSPAGATVFIDDINVGTTPYSNSATIIGPHSIRLEKKGFRTEQQNLSLAEGKPEKIAMTLTNYCDMIIVTEPKYVSLYINGEYQYGSSPYKFQKPAGFYTLECSSWRHVAKTKKVYFDGNQSSYSIKLLRNLTPSDEFYIQLGYNVIGPKSPSAGIGFFCSNINAEGNFFYGFSGIGRVVWNNVNGLQKPVACSYTFIGGNAKVGYGIPIAGRIRFTPQLGYQHLNLSTDEGNIEYIETDFVGGYADVGCFSTYVGSISVGLRFNFAICNHLGINISPEYLIPIFKGDGFKLISAASKDIKAIASGFGCNVGLNIFF